MTFERVTRTMAVEQPCGVCGALSGYTSHVVRFDVHPHQTVALTCSPRCANAHMAQLHLGFVDMLEVPGVALRRGELLTRVSIRLEPCYAGSYAPRHYNTIRKADHVETSSGWVLKSRYTATPFFATPHAIWRTLT